MTPIYIPSKGRAGRSKLLSENEGFNVVVEPQEQHTYKMNHPSHNIIVLPENNMGITYVRNFIKDTTEGLEIARYWILDDDIQAFYYRAGNKMVKCDIYEALAGAESQFEKEKTDLGALEYQQIAWSAGNKNIITNGYCDVCVYVSNVASEGIRYSPEVEGKEDRDFAMQFIKEGLKVHRTTLYAFSAPKNGSNAGGLKEIFYDLSGREQKCCDEMIKKWGNQICEQITKPDGRRDVKINWNKIKQPFQQTSIFNF